MTPDRWQKIEELYHGALGLDRDSAVIANLFDERDCAVSSMHEEVTTSGSK